MSALRESTCQKPGARKHSAKAGGKGGAGKGQCHAQDEADYPGHRDRGDGEVALVVDGPDDQPDEEVLMHGGAVTAAVARKMDEEGTHADELVQEHAPQAGSWGQVYREDPRRAARCEQCGLERPRGRQVCFHLLWRGLR